MKKVTLIILCFMLVSCATVATVSHKEFYNQVAPMKYTPTDKVWIFEYSNVDLDEVYNLLFSDFLIIGKSSFNGPYENSEQAKSYAKSIGADVFLTNSQFKETRTSFMPLTTPTTTTTNISGFGSGGSFSGTATSFGTQTTTIPIRVNRYDQDGIYLKNVNHFLPLWERTISNYKETKKNPLSGTWQNERYKIKIYQSGEQLVGFVAEVINGDRFWSLNQLKMIFGTNSNVGVYLMGNKAPVPSGFVINKFGHLEVKLFDNFDTFSFARMP